MFLILFNCSKNVIKNIIVPVCEQYSDINIDQIHIKGIILTVYMYIIYNYNHVYQRNVLCTTDHNINNNNNRLRLS